MSLHLLVTWQEVAGTVESATEQGGINRAAGAARAVVHGPITLEVSRLLQPGGPYKSTFATVEPETKRQRTGGGAQSIVEGAASLCARHVGLEHVEVLLCSANIETVQTQRCSETRGNESEAIDVDQLAIEIELQSALQRQPTEAGSVNASADGVLLRPPTIEEAATAHVGGGMLSGVSSLFLRAYCAPVAEDCAGDSGDTDGISNLQTDADTIIDAAQAVARARRRRYAQLASCQLWYVEPRRTFSELSVASRM